MNKIYLFLSKYQFYNGLDFKLKLSIALERNKYSFVNAKFNAENSLFSSVPSSPGMLGSLGPQ